MAQQLLDDLQHHEDKYRLRSPLLEKIELWAMFAVGASLLYDFYGIIFKGHPNLKRILNMDEMNYFPMRKEYALEDGTRTDKDDTMFGR